MHTNKLLYPKKRYFLLIIAPIVIWFAFAVLLPIINALRYSFFEWSGGPMKFIGLDNYKTLLHDEVFRLALKNNLIIVVISVIGQIGIALIMAALLSSRMMKLKNFHRTVIFFPVLLSAVVVGFIWTLMYNSNYAEVELLWAMTNAVELLRKDFYRKGVCVIADTVKTIQKKNNKCGIGNRGKTKIVVKEHFSEKGKTMEELLTDVMLEKAKQTIT